MLCPKISLFLTRPSTRNALPFLTHQVDNLLRFLRQKRKKQLNEVDGVFTDVKDDR